MPQSNGKMRYKFLVCLLKKIIH